MSQECEHLLRHMLIVEPDRRFTLKQIAKHKWLSQYNLVNALDLNAIGNVLLERSLDSTVVNHLMQIPGLTADTIAQSVQENRFDHIYAMYYLLVDKLIEKRKEQKRLQHHATMAYSRYIF